METPQVTFQNDWDAIQYVLNTGSAAQFTMKVDKYPLCADAIAALRLVYTQDQFNNVPSVSGYLFNRKTNTKQPIPVILTSKNDTTTVVDVPWWSCKYPFVTCAAPDVELHFDPPPSTIEALGIFYPAKTRYRLSGAVHRFPLLQPRPQQVDKDAPAHVFVYDALNNKITVDTVHVNK